MDFELVLLALCPDLILGKTLISDELGSLESHRTGDFIAPLVKAAGASYISPQKCHVCKFPWSRRGVCTADDKFPSKTYVLTTVPEIECM